MSAFGGKASVAPRRANRKAIRVIATMRNGNNSQNLVAKRQDGDGSNAVSGTVAKCKLIFAAFWGGKGWIEGK